MTSRVPGAHSLPAEKADVVVGRESNSSAGPRAVSERASRGSVDVDMYSPSPAKTARNDIQNTPGSRADRCTLDSIRTSWAVERQPVRFCQPRHARGYCRRLQGAGRDARRDSRWWKSCRSAPELSSRPYQLFRAARLRLRGGREHARLAARGARRASKVAHA